LHRVQIDIKYDCAFRGVPAQAKGAGLATGTALSVNHICIVEGFASVRVLPTLASITGVVKIKLPTYPAARPKPTAGKVSTALIDKISPLPKGTSQRPLPQGGGSPSIDGNGVTIMRADQFITQTGVNGSGASVAVMSDDVTNLSVIQARGELPAVTVVTPTGGGTPSPSPTDEGTMMLEEVYAVAPGVTLLFCGPGTSVEYVSCLQNLITAGGNIVVDDLAWSGEDLMSADGDFAVMVQGVLTGDPFVALFTVTENYNGSYWQGAYAPVSLSSYGYGPISCSVSGQTDYYVQSFNGVPAQTLTVYAAGTYPLTFQWADPYDQNASNFDVYWYNTSTSTSGCVSAVGSTATYFGPSQYLDAGTYYIYVMTPDASLAGKYLKLWIGGDGNTALSDPTTGSIVSPQAFVSGVNTVGAVNGSDGIGDTIESYSGLGPINLIFPSPAQIQAPLFVAPDAIYVDATGTDFQPSPDGFFHGTSAAAPNAASVAALIRSAFPNVTPLQLSNALEQGATALATSPPDGTFGYGRVDALGALSTIPTPSLSNWPNGTVTGGSSTPSTALTVGGFGSLHFSVQSSNPSLIPATLVSQGTAGVTLTPSNCGVGVACMISARPVVGQIGGATVTLIATDGANRTASTAATITVIDPPAPTIAIASGATQTVNVSTAIAPVTFTLTGTAPLTVAPNTNGLATVAISSGCGTTTMSCTASLGNALSTAGTATLQLVVNDSYGQVAQAMATITEVSPPASHGGGGSMTLLALVPLILLTMLRALSVGRVEVGTIEARQS
jgi:hypothetical protein